MKTKSQIFVTDIIITCLCLIGSYILHTNSFIDIDVAWHVEGAKRLLAGGNYLVNIFDDNSPLVFAFYFPVVWLKQLFHINYANLIISYILFTNAISLALCYYIIDKATFKKEFFSKKLSYYTIVFALIFVPAVSMGQREMVLINFLLPYFLILLFATSCPSFKVNKVVYMLCAILASFGIIQNIFYLSIPIFLDIYRYLKTRKFQLYQMVLYGIILIQIAIVIFLYPEYIKTLVPLTLCYESGFNFHLIFLLQELPAILSLAAFVLVIINRKKLRYYHDITMILIALLCSLLIYFLEKKIWYYHIYPALVFSLLLLTFVLIKFYEDISLKLNDPLRVTLLNACIATAIMFTIVRMIVLSGIYEIKIFYNPNYITNQWIEFSNKNFEGKRIFYFAVLEPSYSLPIYSNLQVVSPWMNPWFIIYFLKRENNALGHFCNPERDVKMFYNLVAKSIADTHPDFVVIKIPPVGIQFLNKKANYPQLFTEENIIRLLNNYYLYGYFKNYIIYKKQG